VAEVRQSYSTTVAGTIEQCFAVLTEFDAYPQWSSVIRKVRVLERHPDGLAKRVEFTLDMTIKTIRYVLEYQWEPPVGATWHLVEGDVQPYVTLVRLDRTLVRPFTSRVRRDERRVRTDEPLVRTDETDVRRFTGRVRTDETRFFSYEPRASCVRSSGGPRLDGPSAHSGDLALTTSRKFRTSIAPRPRLGKRARTLRADIQPLASFQKKNSAACSSQVQRRLSITSFLNLDERPCVICTLGERFSDRRMVRRRQW